MRDPLEIRMRQALGLGHTLDRDELRWIILNAPIGADDKPAFEDVDGEKRAAELVKKVIQRRDELVRKLIPGYSSIGHGIIPRAIAVAKAFGVTEPPSTWVPWYCKLPCTQEDRLLAAAVAATEAQADAPADDAGVWDQLSERQKQCLRVLHDEGAIDCENRIVGRRVAQLAEPNSARWKYADDLGHLASLGLVETRRGCDGGCWLSVRGAVLLESRDGKGRGVASCA